MYCKKCVLPDTRPGAFLNEDGVCAACVGHEEKIKTIDWDQRKDQLEKIIEEFRGNAGNYDCLIPVSGGKDSTYQVHMIKNVYKLRPLCFTLQTPAGTELGRRNLENLVNMGVDHIGLSINPETERKFVCKALEKAGNPGLPFHMAAFASTARIAVNYKIPLVIWGESTQMEYGGDDDDRKNPYLDLNWVKKYGCCNGTTVEDWVDENLTAQDLYPYTFPSEEELAEAKVQSIFLGYYFKWDPYENFAIAKECGFQERKDGPIMGLYNFADLDCDFIVVHHFIKWYKFGVTRLFDNVSVEIRNGRMTREEGIQLIKATKVEPPRRHIACLCKFLKISEERFWEILEKFRNHDIWKQDSRGQWYMPDYLKGL
ncbi:MAG: N-acetyl sugar amidotransferase [Nitrospinales bacterium]